MKKMCKIKTLFRHGISVFILLFAPATNVMAHNNINNRSFEAIRFMHTGSKPANEHMTRGMSKTPRVALELATQIATLTSYAGLFPTIETELVVSLSLLSIRAVYNVYELYESLNDNYNESNRINKRIQNDFNLFCNELAKNVVQRKIKYNITAISEISKNDFFKACVADDETYNFTSILANDGINVYSDRIRISSTKKEKDTIFLDLEDFKQNNYNTTKISAAMSSGCIEPFLDCKNSFCCSDQQNKVKHNITPHINHNNTNTNTNNIDCRNILECPKIYGYEPYRLAISLRHNINIVKSPTNKNTYDCFNENVECDATYRGVCDL